MEEKVDAGGGRRIAWPWYVRVLAVAYVLSLVAGPAGFFALAALGSYLYVRDGLSWNRAAVAFMAALACPLGCAVFRQWFRNWGQRRWPQPETGEAPSQRASPQSGQQDGI